MINQKIKAALPSNVKEWIKRNPLFRIYDHSQRYWLYPIIALGWKISRLCSPRKKIKIGPVNFTLSCINWITFFRWYLFKKKEPEVRYYIDNYVHEKDIFFDIGANVGVFSVYCAKKYKDISVFSFEPEYSNLYLLKDNIILNNLQDKVTITSAALSNFVGISSLFIQDVTPGAAVHTESKKKIKRTDEGYEVVWSEGIIAVTIDYICENYKVIPNCIKIDTDGNEDKILKGAGKTLKNKSLRNLILEMPMDKKKMELCKKLLKASGFHLEWDDPDKTRNEIWIKKN